MAVLCSFAIIQSRIFSSIVIVPLPDFFHVLITNKLTLKIVLFLAQIKLSILQKFFSNPWFDFILQSVVVTPQYTAFPEP